MGLIVEMIEAATGWKTSLWELLKAGERANTLYRLFNHRHGMTSVQDALPALFFRPFADGPLAGEPGLDPDEFREAVHLYYSMAGWHPETGIPTAGKLAELGLEEYLDLVS
jgi:aldehyde:ferredoxin oxidoreductase